MNHNCLAVLHCLPRYIVFIVKSESIIMQDMIRFHTKNVILDSIIDQNVWFDLFPCLPMFCPFDFCLLGTSHTGQNIRGPGISSKYIRAAVVNDCASGASVIILPGRHVQDFISGNVRKYPSKSHSRCN